jgi:hypothetical protein
MPSDEEVSQRAGSLRAMTGLTRQAFSTLRPPVERAVLASREDHTSAGQPRTSRRDRPQDTSPFPTMADQWLFMLADRQPHPI